MLQPAGRRLGQHAGKLRAVALGDDDRLHGESGGRAKNRADIVRIGDLVEQQDQPAGRGDIGEVALGQGAGLQQQPLMHGLLAEPPRQLARLDELGLKPRRLRHVLDARDRVGGGVERHELALAGGQRLAHGVGAIDQRGLGGPGAAIASRLAGGSAVVGAHFLLLNAAPPV